MAIDTNSIFQAHSDCLAEDMDGELLVYNPVTATTLHLNGPSAIVYGLCDGQNSVAEIIAKICAAYPDQAAQIPNDVTQAIEGLVQQKVIELIKLSGQG